jgi:hypothetical protein
MNRNKSYRIDDSGRDPRDAQGNLIRARLGFCGTVLTFARAERPGDKPNSVKIVDRSSQEQIPDEHFKNMVKEAKSLLWPSKPKGAGF